MTPYPSKTSLRPTASEQQIYFQLMQVQGRLMEELNALFRRHALSQPLWNALRVVHGAGTKGIRSQRIGDELLHRDPDTTRLIDRLKTAGLVERQRSEVDRRVILVRITPRGRRKLDELEPEVLALHQRQLGHLSASHRELLSDLLAKILRPPNAA